MFTSQLLRILQTIPTDVNYESAFGTCDSKLAMKENQIGIFYHSDVYEREADPLSFSSSDLCPTNGCGRNTDHLAFGMQDEHDIRNTSVPKCSEVLDNCTNTRGSPLVGGQDGIFSHLNGGEQGVESLASDRKDKDETQSTPEFVHTKIDDEVSHRNEKESGDSKMPCAAVQSNVQSYTDKNVLECELPELAVCNRESNFNVVKDICVDEGVPAQDKILIGSDNDDHADSSDSQPSNEYEHSVTTNGGLEIELHIPDEFKASLVEDVKHDSGDECGAEEVDIVSSVWDGSKSSSEDITCKTIAKGLRPETLGHRDEVNWSTTDKTKDDISGTEFAISSPLVSEEFIVQDSLLGSSNFDGKKATQPPDEIPPIEAILESLAVVFTSKGSKKYGPVGNLCCNNKLDGGTITCDFNSSKPAVASAMDGSAEIIHENSPKAEDGQLDDIIAPAAVQCANSVQKSNENAHDQNPTKQDLPDHENVNSGNLLVSGQVQRGEGETSFSASGPVSGLITYSGPIAYSGSISIRSDSSTTSARSFAFPVLQSEWNSSPVRMRKADRQHLRKQRGWRHGLFCCRF